MKNDFRHVAIVGLGLIGGSVAAGLRSRGRVERITAFDQNAISLHHALDTGLIDDSAVSVERAVEGAELIVVAVPVLAMPGVFASLKPWLGDPACVITDVGSVKGEVLRAATQVEGSLPNNYVPGHPIAGSEQHGVRAANPDLFERHKVILTPTETTIPAATARVRHLWRVLGAEIDEMDAAHHDSILAQTSHLPHLLAYALVDTLSSGGDSLEIFEYAAGGFRDFSRIAASDPIMWRDIFRTNRDPVLEVLDRFRDRLDELRDMIEFGKSDELSNVFARSKSARDHFSRLIEARHAEIRAYDDDNLNDD